MEAMKFENGMIVNLAQSLTSVAKLNNQLNMSPTLKARGKPLNKTEIEDTVFSQFPPKASPEANLYDRAIKIYEKQKEFQGFKMKELNKPNVVFHAHIEAMDDQVAVSRYPIEKQM